MLLPIRWQTMSPSTHEYAKHRPCHGSQDPCHWLVPFGDGVSALYGGGYDWQERAYVICLFSPSKEVRQLLIEPNAQKWSTHSGVCLQGQLKSWVNLVVCRSTSPLLQHFLMTSLQTQRTHRISTFALCMVLSTIDCLLINQWIEIDKMKTKMSAISNNFLFLQI